MSDPASAAAEPESADGLTAEQQAKLAANRAALEGLAGDPTTPREQRDVVLEWLALGLFREGVDGPLWSIDTDAPAKPEPTGEAAGAIGRNHKRALLRWGANLKRLDREIDRSDLCRRTARRIPERHLRPLLAARVGLPRPRGHCGARRRPAGVRRVRTGKAPPGSEDGEPHPRGYPRRSKSFDDVGRVSA
jgi:hypothetical protein